MLFESKLIQLGILNEISQTQGNMFSLIPFSVARETKQTFDVKVTVRLSEESNAASRSEV